MKTSRKKMLLSSIAMLLVALVALGSATYAWFSINKTVTADTMNVEVAAAKGLQITGTNGAADAAPTAADWVRDYHFAALTNKVLSPASLSTAEGASDNLVSAKTVYSTEVTHDGKSIGNTETGYSSTFADTNTVAPKSSGDSGQTDQYVAAYEVGVRSKDALATISNVTFSLELGYTDAKVKDYVRVAVIPQAGAAVDYTTDTVSKTFGNEKSPKALATKTDATGTTQSLTAISWDTNNKTATCEVATNLSVSAAKYYTILVWFEGEDTECTSANAQGEFNVKAKFAAA